MLLLLGACTVLRCVRVVVLLLECVRVALCAWCLPTSRIKRLRVTCDMRMKGRAVALSYVGAARGEWGSLLCCMVACDHAHTAIHETGTMRLSVYCFHRQGATVGMRHSIKHGERVMRAVKTIGKVIFWLVAIVVVWTALSLALRYGG